MPTVRFQLRRDTASNWTSVNPTLGPGEPALETDTGKAKHGDGSTPWASLPYSWAPPSSFMQSLMDDTDATAARATLGAVSTARSISTGAGLVGGGSLASDRTLSLATSGVTAGSYGSATKVPTITLDAYGRATIASENTIPALASGTYTPVLTGIANLDGATPYPCQFMRVGNVVTVSGRVDIDCTSVGTFTRLGISLPIPSNLANDYECGGTANAISVASMSGGIRGDAANDRAELSLVPTVTTAQGMFFSFQYKVI